MKKIILFILSAWIIIPLTGCDDFLVENPETIVAPDNLFTSRAGIEQAVNGIYEASTRMHTNRYYYLMYDLPSDNITYLKTNASRIEIEQFKMVSTNGNIERAWRTYYEGVTRANVVLENLPEKFGNQAFLDRSTGEAKFLRAWYYFYLVRTFGEVPLLIGNGDNPSPPRAPVADVYAQIIQDLKDAETLLPSWTTYAPGSTDAGRASRGAAKGLLAKVYLTRASTPAAQPDDYANAAEKANEVIQSGEYGLIDSYVEAFFPENENGIESLFAGQCAGNTRTDCSHYTDMSPPETEFGERGFANWNITDDLYNAFESDDKRLETILTGTYVTTNGDTLTTDGLWSIKFKDPVNFQRANHGTNYPFLRYSEVLLIFAEADNEVNNAPTPEAYAAINEVRNRVGLTDLAGLTKAQFREAVFQERRVELYFEADRWFDLVRSKTLKEKVESAKPGVTVQIPKHYRFPLPQRELDVNKNLTQNEGY